MKAHINNNTASLDAENAGSAQKSGNICSISAILAYVIIQNLMADSICFWSSSQEQFEDI
jgi:hypothetical protein